MNAASLSAAVSSATSTAIRSLNADFVRKGIVVSGDYELDPSIRHLVESLKSSCKDTGKRELGDITSAIQLWKERSLHHTLQTLDHAKNAAPSDWQSVGTTRHIQAIELHDKAGRDIKDAVLRVLQNVVDAIVQRIDGFTVELQVVLRELVKPEIEEELAHERAITVRLVEEKQRLIKDQTTLQEAHTMLTKRVSEWETAEDGGGDAILCRKLREHVKKLKDQHDAMEARMLGMGHQHEQWRYEMTTMQTELEMLYKTLAMTRAMHDKETKHFAELLQCRDDQFDRVRHATAVAKVATALRTDSSSPNRPPTVTAYEVHSGRAICYQSPTKASPLKATRTVLATMPPAQPRCWKSAEPICETKSPNQKRFVASARPIIPSNRQDEETTDFLSGVEQPNPQGRVAWPLSSSRSSTTRSNR